jgi:hypothetical protein
MLVVKQSLVQLVMTEFHFVNKHANTSADYTNSARDFGDPICEQQEARRKVRFPTPAAMRLARYF